MTIQPEPTSENSSNVTEGGEAVLTSATSPYNAVVVPKAVDDQIRRVQSLLPPAIILSPNVLIALTIGASVWDVNLLALEKTAGFVAPELNDRQKKRLDAMVRVLVCMHDAVGIDQAADLFVSDRRINLKPYGAAVSPATAILEEAFEELPAYVDVLVT